jgi:hypothetical protein
MFSPSFYYLPPPHWGVEGEPSEACMNKSDVFFYDFPNAVGLSWTWTQDLTCEKNSRTYIIIQLEENQLNILI